LSNNRLDRIWEAPLLGLSGLFSSDEFAHLPRVDVTEDKKEVTVKAEIPGMSEKDVECTWHDGVLRIRGEKKSEREDKKAGRQYHECSYGYFSRDIPLGDSVDWKAAVAKYKHGVLTVKLPKTESARKTITVKIN